MADRIINLIYAASLIMAFCALVAVTIRAAECGAPKCPVPAAATRP